MRILLSSKCKSHLRTLCVLRSGGSSFVSRENGGLRFGGRFDGGSYGDGNGRGDGLLDQGVGEDWGEDDGGSNGWDAFVC